MEDKTIIAFRIEALEERIDELGGPAANPGPAARLAHARKEWAHGLPETYAVAQRDIDAAYLALGDCPGCGSDLPNHKMSCDYESRRRREGQDVRRMIR